MSCCSVKLGFLGSEGKWIRPDFVSVFQSSIVVEAPRYSRKTTGPVHVQFYVSNGKRRKSVAQTFTYTPAVGRRLSAAAATQLIKQEAWELDHISHNPPGFSPDVAYYDSSDLPVHCGPPSQNAPVHNPLPSVPLFNPTSSPITCQTSVHHQTAIPPQTSIPFHSSTLPPQASSGQLQTFTVHPQTSSLPPQTTSLPLQAASVGPQGEPSPCLSPSRPYVIPTDAQKNILSASPGQMLSVKQEPEDQSNLGSLVPDLIQEITLDDGRSKPLVDFKGWSKSPGALITFSGKIT